MSASGAPCEQIGASHITSTDVDEAGISVVGHDDPLPEFRTPTPSAGIVLAAHSEDYRFIPIKTPQGAGNRRALTGRPRQSRIFRIARRMKCCDEPALRL